MLKVDCWKMWKSCGSKLDRQLLRKTTWFYSFSSCDEPWPNACLLQNKSKTHVVYLWRHGGHIGRVAPPRIKVLFTNVANLNPRHALRQQSQPCTSCPYLSKSDVNSPDRGCNESGGWVAVDWSVALTLFRIPAL